MRYKADIIRKELRSMEKEIKWNEIISLHVRVLKDMNHYVPGRIPCLVMKSVVDAISPYITIWLSAQIINELATLRRGDKLTEWVAWTLLVTAGLGILKAVLTRWNKALYTLEDPMKERMYMDKFLSMDYAHIDSHHIRDLKAQIDQFEQWMEWGPDTSLAITSSILEAVLGVFGAVALTVSLFTQKVSNIEYAFLNSTVFVVVLGSVMAGIIWLGTKCTRLYNAKESALAEDATLGNRLFGAYMDMCQEGERRLDIRTYNQQNATAHFLASSGFRNGGSFHTLDKGRYGFLKAVGSGMGAVFTGVVYVFACLKAWAGAFSVGSVTQYVGAVTSLSGNITKILENVDRMRNNHRFLTITYELLDTKNEMYQGSLTTEKRSDRQYNVEFRDVSFKYSGSETWALRHVNMKFKVGSRLAIVGENGSGKTTFIKLLCRLYDPQEGQILLNGIDIRKYRYEEYVNIFSVVFQDFQLMAQPLGANVAGSMEYDRERVEKALSDAGLIERLANMEKGLDTMLYKEFSKEGVEISGGEAQKIAIARALYKDAPFIILDEPTAALDPMAEAEIYSKFNDIVTDKTAIYISHRLSSCKFCDEIVVFHEGSVIQQGTHAELVADENGKYYELWNAQAQYYAE